MRQIPVPGWLKNLPGDSSLNNRDMIGLFGYSVKTSANQLVRDGLLPKPSWSQKGFAQGLRTFAASVIPTSTTWLATGKMFTLLPFQNPKHT